MASWFCRVFPFLCKSDPPQPPSPPPPTPDILGCTDAWSITYNPLATKDNGTCSYPDIWMIPGDATERAAYFFQDFHGFNCARAFNKKFKNKDGKYWFQDDNIIRGIVAAGVTVLRNGGTVVMGQRFSTSTGNAYQDSIGQWPVCFSEDRRNELVTPPDLSEFISMGELQQDRSEDVNFFHLYKAALESTFCKAVLVINPYQPVQEVSDLIAFIGPDNIAQLVLGNELNSPKAYRLGIRAEDVMFWADAIKPIADANNLPLVVGIPPYEWKYRENTGQPLNSKLLADKDFVLKLADYQVETNNFDGIAFHPYRQVPDRDPLETTEQYLHRLEDGWNYNDGEILGAQIALIDQLFPGTILCPDEHGIEHPEYGHMGSPLSLFHYAIRMMELAIRHNVSSSCYQLLMAEPTQEGGPQSFVYLDPLTGEFRLSPEFGVFAMLSDVASIDNVLDVMVSTDKPGVADEAEAYAFSNRFGQNIVVFVNLGSTAITTNIVSAGESAVLQPDINVFAVTEQSPADVKGLAVPPQSITVFTNATFKQP